MNMTEHYFSEKPKSSFVREKFTHNLLGNDIIINSGSGIFSIKEIDKGTKLIIENCAIQDNDKVLDMGCGYGVIGISLKKTHPLLNVTLSDINERAVKLALENCIENNVKCDVYKSDLFSNPELNKRRFNVILTNPPFSAGKKVCIDLIMQSYDHLETDGTLQLVAPHNKGGDSLKKVMMQIFGNVAELAKKSGYRVYSSKKSI